MAGKPGLSWEFLALAGLATPFAIRAFGMVPINPAAGSRSLHELAEELKAQGESLDSIPPLLRRSM